MRYLTTKEVAVRLGVTDRTVCNYRRRERDFPKPRRVGPCYVRYVEAEIEHWLATRPLAEDVPWKKRRRKKKGAKG